jgi:hypothetical protein
VFADEDSLRKVCLRTFFRRTSHDLLVRMHVLSGMLGEDEWNMSQVWRRIGCASAANYLCEMKLSNQMSKFFRPENSIHK